jgi:MOSC N-terminal beta barrel domain/Aminotransferase class-V
VLLDAAKAAQAEPPDLARHPAHFVALSFYKIFGYPTGIGALLVRSDCLHLLQPRTLGGGTLESTLPCTWPSLPVARQGVAAFEPGTLNYQAIRQLAAGFDAWERATQKQAGAHCSSELAKQLVTRLAELRHTSGVCAIEVYARRASAGTGQSGSSDSVGSGMVIGIGEAPGSAARTGATVPFNVYDAAGAPVSCHAVASELAAAGVVARAGRCCNPGACAAVLGFSDADLREQHAAGVTCGGSAGVWRGRHVGVVRASLGPGSSERDVRCLVNTLARAFVATAPVWPPVRGDCVHQGSAQQGNLSAGQQSPGQAAECTTSNSCKCNTAAGCCLAAICVYPVKSCGGMSVPAWPVTGAGLLFDRTFQIIDRSGRALTLARFPQLAQLSTSINLEASQLIIVHTPSGAAAAPGELSHGCCSACQSSSVAVAFPEHLQPGSHSADLAAADTLVTTSNGRQLAAVLVDSGVQSLKSAHAGLQHGAACQRVAQTQGAADGQADAQTVHSWLSQVLNTQCFLVTVAPASRPSAAGDTECDDVSSCSSLLGWLQVGDKAEPLTSRHDAEGTSQHASACRTHARNADIAPGCDPATGQQQPFVNASELLVATTASAAAFSSAFAAQCPPQSRAPATSQCVGACSACKAPVLQVSWADSMLVIHRFRVNLLFGPQGQRHDGYTSMCGCEGALGEPHAEDSWQCVPLPLARCPEALEPCWQGHAAPGAKLCLRAAGPARRCAAVNVDWAARTRDAGCSALRVLASYRRSCTGSVTWGAYMRPDVLLNEDADQKFDRHL